MPMTMMVPVDRQKIRELREDLGLSQTEAARRAGWRSYQSWQHIESGTADPGVSKLQRVAAVLGVSVDDLLTPLEGDEWKDA